MTPPEGFELCGWICRHADGFVALYKVDAEERGRRYAADNHATFEPMFARTLTEVQKWPGSLAFPWLPSA